MRGWTTTFVALLTFVGCAPDLRDEFPFDGKQTAGSRVSHEELGDGVMKTHVDASEREAWIYFDLDGSAELTVDEALETQAWDLAFQRFKIITNSGVSGPGQVGVHVIPEGAFDALTAAPQVEYLPDRPDGSDGNTDVDSGFLEGDGWYSYDLLKHELSPRPRLYVVQSGGGRYFKMEVLSYYDDAGTAGVLTFRWAEIASP
jgi:hypothetical protein